jgi:hypothetical protein
VSTLLIVNVPRDSVAVFVKQMLMNVNQAHARTDTLALMASIPSLAPTVMPP